MCCGSQEGLCRPREVRPERWAEVITVGGVGGAEALSMCHESHQEREGK